MNRAARNRLTQSLVVAAAAVASACGSDLTGPGRGASSAAPLAAATRTTSGDAAARGPELSGCAQLHAPQGSRLVARLYARGVQIYRWTGTGWLFVAPSAVLYSDAAGHDPVGTHYAGPTWQSTDGSTVQKTPEVAPVACVADASAIPWLLLATTPGPTSGLFRRVTSIQRVNTVGGKAPSAPGTTPGEERHELYSAEYYFYRAP
jgi:hypothetical protein